MESARSATEKRLMTGQRNGAICDPLQSLLIGSRRWGGRKRFMKKASKPSVIRKPAPTKKKSPAKAAKPKKAQGGTGLAEVVVQLSRTAEKLTQATDKLAEAAARLSAVAEGRHESTAAPERPTPDEAPQEEPETADNAAQDEYADRTERFR
jgi:hypothetical protein